MVLPLMQGVLECPVSRTAHTSAQSCLTAEPGLAASCASETPQHCTVDRIKDVISFKRVELGFMFPFVSLPKSFTYNKHKVIKTHLMASKTWLVHHLPPVPPSCTLTCKMCCLRACHILLSIQLFTGMVLNEKHSYLPGNTCHTPNTILSVIT